MIAARTYPGWAVDLGIADHPSPSIAGIFYFQREAPAPHHDAMRAAVFRTRKQARAAIAGMSAYSQQRANVIRVRVHVEVVAAKRVTP